MLIISSIPTLFRQLQHSTVSWLISWWRLLQFAVLMLTLALQPASYRGANLTLLARRIVRDSAPNLAWYGALSALVSLVLIRIVVVTSQSYGLSRFALEMVVRVLVLELIPLTAAAYIALRTTLPAALVFLQRSDATVRTTAAALQQEFFPRVAAGIFAVWLLAAVSCVSTLLLTYLSLYGFTPWALPGYTRVVGQVFHPAVALILALKIFFFSLAVGLIPMAACWIGGSSDRPRLTHGLYHMVRLFTVMLLIEVASLMGNYY